MTMAPGQPEAQPDAHVDLSATDGAVAIKGRTPWQIVVSRLKRDKVTLVAGAITGLFLLAALLSPLLDALGVIDPYGTNPKLVTGVGSLPTGPLGGMSIDHWLGVEPGTGRDMFSRILAGLTTSLTVAVLATIISVLVGTVLGLISGFAGGWIDWGVSRVMDLLLSFPADPHAAHPVGRPAGRDARRRCTSLRGAPSSIAFLVLFLSVLRLAVLRPRHPRAGALAARARVHRGGGVPGGQAGPALLQGAPARTCGRRSSSTPR